MIIEQLRHVLGVTVGFSPLEVGRVEFRSLRFIGLWFSGWLRLFLFSLTNYFDFLFLNDWFGELFPLLILELRRLYFVLKTDD